MRLRWTYRVSSIFALFCLMLLSLAPASSIAQEELSGAQSGTLPSGLYDVVDDISVEPWTTWTLEAGARLRFYPNTSCDVHGILLAEGAEGDSVFFTRYNSEQPWGGIDVSGGCYLGLNYGVVTGSDDNGIHCNSGILKLVNSRISNNSDVNGEGGGIYSFFAPYDTLTNVTISTNDGIGYYGEQNNTKIRDSIIEGNTGTGVHLVYSHMECDKVVFRSNLNSALFNGGSHCFVDSCYFIDNSALNGGAINAAGYFRAYRSVFYGNHAVENGGVIYDPTPEGSNRLHNCIVSNNSAGLHGSAFYLDGINLKYSIIVNNEGDAAIYSYENGTIPYYNIFFNNGEDMLTELPPSPVIHFGEITTVNINGDSCDIHYNLFMDPLFESEEDLLFLLSALSPAIDAGDPEEPFDPDGTIADIGIHYFDQSAFVYERMISEIPTEFGIRKVYPNPFNSQVIIEYEFLPSAEIHYSLHSITGRILETGSLGSAYGKQQFIWKPRDDVATGIYLLRVGNDSQDAAIKIIYMK